MITTFIVLEILRFKILAVSDNFRLDFWVGEAKSLEMYDFYYV